LAAQHDALYCEAVSSNHLEKLLGISNEVLEGSFTDSFWQKLILASELKAAPMDITLFNYARPSSAFSWSDKNMGLRLDCFSTGKKREILQRKKGRTRYCHFFIDDPIEKKDPPTECQRVNNRRTRQRQYITSRLFPIWGLHPIADWSCLLLSLNTTNA
jgi:hypothetical protein